MNLAAVLRGQLDAFLGRAPTANGGSSRDTRGAAGLGLAAALDSFLVLVFTVVLARVLGPAGYGSLAALTSTFLILAIAGTGLQTTVAREIGWRSAAGEMPPRSSVRRWSSALTLVALSVLIASLLLREAIAAVIGVDEEWAAAVTVPMAALWLLISFQRGVLLGASEYRAVGLSVVAEPAGWLLLGGTAAFLGLGVTGALLGMAGAEIAVALFLYAELGRRSGADARAGPAAWLGFRQVLGGAAVPMAALVLFAFLQNVDVIAVNHLASQEAVASSYAAASVAAKVIVWIAIGVGFYLLPEAARRAASGLDVRRLLARGFGVVLATAAPMILLYALAGQLLLEAVFGADLDAASSALALLGVAMTLLAITYLMVQYQLALGRKALLYLLGLAALIEPMLLVLVGMDFTQIALALVGLQLVLASSFLALSVRSPRLGRGIA